MKITKYNEFRNISGSKLSEYFIRINKKYNEFEKDTDKIELNDNSKHIGLKSSKILERIKTRFESLHS